jgi:hypothetical protein
MIKQIIENYGLKVNNNIIDLGWVNGWGKGTQEVYKELKKYLVEDTHRSITIGRCVTEYKFKSTDGFDFYTVVYKVDSGD